MFEIALTPAKVTSEAIKFRIPLYQRPYAWEETQVTQLLDDLHEAFSKEPEADYHTGILSVAPTSDDSARFDLIDGQQRITTLLLIGKVAKMYSTVWNHFIEPHRLDLYGREDDKKFLNDEATEDCNRRMRDAVRCASDYFEEKIDESVTRKAFAEFIYHHAAFFLSQVPPSYSLMDKNQQFVRMNNRGKQLEKHEILKVQLLSKIPSEYDRSKAFSIWNDMLSCLTGMDDGQQTALQSLRDILRSGGESSDAATKEVLKTSILTVPEFLLIALARYLKTEICFKTDRLLETFSVLKNQECIDGFIDLLNKQVEIFQSFFIFLSKQEKYEFCSESDTENNNFDFGSNSGGQQRLIAVQSFLHISTEPHHWMIPAFNWCESQGRPLKSIDFINELESIDNSLTHDNIRKVSQIDDIERMIYGSVRHYWFYRLDYELLKLYDLGTETEGIWAKLPKEKSIQDLLKTFRFRRCGSVDHIVPQTTMEGLTPHAPDHSFGNLALISSSRNSRFSNLPIEGKMSLLLQSGYTESLKMLHFLTCDSHSTAHGKAMFDILNRALIHSQHNQILTTKP